MAAPTYTLPRIEQGSTWGWAGTWKEEDDTPIDISAYTSRMDLKKTPSSTAAISLTTANGRIALNETTGTVRLSLSATDTAGLAAGWYYYDIELVNGSTVERWLQGRVQVHREITR